MLQNYLTIAWRNITRNKISSVIHIAGLSIGIACALLILIFINNELAYDKFHKDADRIFQVTISGNFDGQEFDAGNTPPPVGAALVSNFPEIETYTRFYKPNDMVVRYDNAVDNKFFTEKNVLAVDSNFLEVFSFDMIEGNPTTALMKPGSIVLTEPMAKKYFGSDRAVGKTLQMMENKKPFLVTGVLKDIPTQSSIQFDFLAPMADFPVVKRFSWSWIWQQVVTYVKLRPNFEPTKENINALEAKFPAMVKVQAASAFRRIGKPFDEFLKNGGRWDIGLIPITDIHLKSGDFGMPWLTRISNIKYIYIFGSVAVFIILLACINFMNLSTARSQKRAKEVGIRKVVGSSRGQMIWQFMAEAFIFSIVSAVIAVILVFLSLKSFNVITGEVVPVENALSPQILLSLFLLTIVVGLLAGSYPAFYLTSFNPVSVLKGRFKTGKAPLLVRNGLVVFQFTISTIIIIVTLIVFEQLNYFRKANMGFTKDNVLVIENSNRLGESEETFKQTISQLPGVSHASISTSIPSGFLFTDTYYPEKTGKEAVTEEVSLSSFLVSNEFIPALDIKILKGRNFSRDFNDSLSVIVNEEAVRQIGWKDPVGQYITYPGGNNEKYQVIAVVKDFNVQSLHQPMIPFVLFHTKSNSYDMGRTHILARIKAENISATVAAIQTKWKQFATAEPFDYNFLDITFDAQYRGEQRMGNIFGIFATISIFIACLGLFGLCAFVAERRTKEIGVRKVLGASVQGLVGLLSKDFLKLTLIAALIAFPVAWWVMQKWLEDFAYRVKVEWTVFAFAGIATLIIALVTISFQAIKTALANPVKSLRSE